MSNLKVFTIEGISFLGRFDGTSPVSGVLQITRDTKHSLWEWVKENNLGNLKVLDISKGTGFITRDLTGDEEEFYEFLLKNMVKAKLICIAELENKTFERLSEGK